MPIDSRFVLSIGIISMATCKINFFFNVCSGNYYLLYFYWYLRLQYFVNYVCNEIFLQTFVV